MHIQTPLEEKWNTLTHGFGFVLFLLGSVFLCWNNKFDEETVYIALGLYGISLITLYGASTLYHFSKNGSKKERYRKFDHISIYLLIAGTYSPIALIFLRESKGTLLFMIVWGIAAIGTILKIFFTGRFEVLSVVLYVVMGWLIVIDINALQAAVDTFGITMLIAGGVAYTTGIIFYAWNKLYFNHVIWHVFVLAGSIFHYVFIYHQVT